MNKRIICLILVIIMLAGAGTAVFLSIKGNKPATDKPGETGEPSTVVPGNVEVLRKLDGNAELTDDRSILLNQHLISAAKRQMNGVPYVDENGSYVAKEDGALLTDVSAAADYSNLEYNLAVLINTFCDKCYNSAAVVQIERMYYHFCKNYSAYDTDELIEKFTLCFPQNGTNPEELTDNAQKIFGHVRDDGYPFVFEDEIVGEINILCCEVKPYFTHTLTVEQNNLSLFDILNGGIDCEHDRNLKLWLNRIIYELSNVGYGEKEIVTAQLLYAGSLADSEYRADIVDCIRECIPSDTFTLTTITRDGAVQPVSSIISAKITVSLLLHRRTERTSMII